MVGFADLGKHWPQLPVARKRAVLTALVERIEVSRDQIDIRLRPPRLGAPLDVTATPLQSVTADEIQTLSGFRAGVHRSVLVRYSSGVWPEITLIIVRSPAR
jgi:hypothetical protein